MLAHAFILPVRITCLDNCPGKPHPSRKHPPGHTYCCIPLAGKRLVEARSAHHESPLLTSIQQSTGGGPMLRYAVIFFIIAIIAAVFGFGGIAAGATEIAKVLFFIFVVIFLVTLLMGVMRR
jgi:uncharacterized membrane protein YtjA (UPF0391 family)